VIRENGSFHTTQSLDQKGTFSMSSSHSPSRLSVMFDDDHAVADAGLALVGVLSAMLGLEDLAEDLVEVHPFLGRRVATLVHAMVAGAHCIDDADVLRSGSTAEVLAHKVMAPSTRLWRDFRVIPGRWQRAGKVFPLRVR